MAAPKRPAPPKRSNGGSTPATGPSGPVQFGTVDKPHGKRVCIYGPGGIGKTSLALLAPGPVAVFDLDGSLPDIAGQLEGREVRPIEGADTWQGIRDALHSPGWDDVRTIVIDSATAAEEQAVAHTLATVPSDKGATVSRIEDYGYGKGYTHVYETFLPLLGDLEQHTRAGRNVILIAHDCTSPVPNPLGDDYIRYEPRLQNPTSGKASIRLRLREWVAFMFFVAYDLDVKQGKARGENTRTIYTTEMPHCMAKRRTLYEVDGVGNEDQFPYDHYDDGRIWQAVFGPAE